MSEQPYRDHFVTYLEELRDSEDRAALAAMRRWLSQPTMVGEATPYVQRRLSVNIVFPTGVGVNRHGQVIPILTQSIPHRRGGEPLADYTVDDKCTYSPQAWG